MIASWPPDPPRFAAGRIGHLASLSYTSSGVTSPVSAGVYTWAGEYNGQLYFKNAGGTLFLWWFPGLTCWVLSATLGSIIGGFWNSPTTAIPGTYVPNTPNTGNPIVVVTP